MYGHKTAYYLVKNPLDVVADPFQVNSALNRQVITYFFLDGFLILSCLCLIRFNPFFVILFSSRQKLLRFLFILFNVYSISCYEISCTADLCSNLIYFNLLTITFYGWVYFFWTGKVFPSCLYFHMPLEMVSVFELAQLNLCKRFRVKYFSS